MKKRFLLLLVPITAFLLESCCNCDEPIVHTITPNDIVILPVNANDDSIAYTTAYDELLHASSHHDCDIEERSGRDCGFGKSLGCDCPDNKDDACEYNLQLEGGHYFTISFVKNSNGLRTRFILDGKHLTQTGTLSSFTLNNKEYSNVLVFDYSDETSRVALSDDHSKKTLYAPGIGLLQMLCKNGEVFTIAE